jgi:anti-sigma factor RsiW
MDLLLSELPPEREILMHQHLAECPGCRALLEEQKSLLQELRSSEDLHVPTRLKSELKERMFEERTSRGAIHRLLNRPVRFYQMALVVLVCLLAYSTVLQLSLVRGVQKTEAQLERAVRDAVDSRDTLVRFHSAPARLIYNGRM